MEDQGGATCAGERDAVQGRAIKPLPPARSKHRHWKGVPAWPALLAADWHGITHHHYARQHQPCTMAR